MASTITGTFLNSNNSPRTGALVQFAPMQTPFVLNGDIITTVVEQTHTDGSGVLSQVLVAGYYNVHVDNTDTFVILVPLIDGTYDIKDIVTQIGDTPIGAVNIITDISTIAAQIEDTSTITFNHKGDTNAIPLRVAVIGDYGVNTSDEAKVALGVAAQRPDFIVTTGDNNYPNGDPATIDDNVGKYYSNFIFPYTGIYGSTATTNLFYPAIGNHDFDGTGYTAYTDYFTLPTNGGAERYYSYKVANARFIVLNSDQNEPDGYAPDSDQAVWFTAQVAAAVAAKEWPIIAYFHHSPYSSETGYSGDWMNLWSFDGVTMVISGHAHEYERLLKNGIPFFVVGTGGQNSHISFGSPISGSQYRLAEYGHLMLEITDYAVKTKFITFEGVVADPYVIPHPDKPLLYANEVIHRNRGIIITEEGAELDFGVGPHKVAQNPLSISLNQGGYIIRVDSLLDAITVAENPVLKNCLLLLGDDPAPIYGYNKQKKDWVLYVTAADPTPYHGSPDPQLAPPTFDPTSGSIAEGVIINHVTSGVVIWVSVNGSDYFVYAAPLLFTDRGIRYVAAYAKKTGYVDSDIVVAEYED